MSIDDDYDGYDDYDDEPSSETGGAAPAALHGGDGG